MTARLPETGTCARSAAPRSAGRRDAAACGAAALRRATGRGGANVPLHDAAAGARAPDAPEVEAELAGQARAPGARRADRKRAARGLSRRSARRPVGRGQLGQRPRRRRDAASGARRGCRRGSRPARRQRLRRPRWADRRWPEAAARSGRGILAGGADDRDRIADGGLASLGHEDLEEDGVLGRLVVHARLVGLDLAEHGARP